jgi:ABC-type antimicrobial peptide transport system permease subunit
MGLIGGGLGAIFGATVAFIGTLAINNFIGSESKPVINITLIIASLIGSFLIGAVSGIIPAMKAARQNPVDALRN